MFAYLVAIGALVLVGFVVWIRWFSPYRISALVAAVLVRLYPGVIREVLRRRRLSHWHKTSRSEGDQRVWGYADRHSIEPGGVFRLMLSAGPGAGAVSGQLEIARIGSYEGTHRNHVWTSDPIDVKEHGINNTAAAVGPAWPVALTVADTGSWTSGYYSIDFVDRHGARDADIAFLVVTSPKRDVDVLVKLSTATYQAYNRWGGHSLYEWETPSTFEGRGFGVFETDVPANRGHMVSFDRPTRSEFWDWEYYFVVWLEQLAHEEGFSVAYATNFDLTADAAFTSDCKLLVSVGHDEYWSKEEFDSAHERIFAQGGNTLFLGANTAYWQVRYADVNSRQGAEEGRQMTCYKSLDDPIRCRVEADPDLYVTARFREGARRPETMLVGVAYQSNLPYREHLEPPYAYRVVSVDLPFFEGTGYRAGDEVAAIIGHEWDNRDPEAEYECPGEPRVEASDRLWHEQRSHIQRLPEDLIEVVFAGEVVDVHGRKGRAEAVYWESRAGARVFSAGTNRWTWGLGKAGFVQGAFRRFNRNLVLGFLRGLARSGQDPMIS